MSPHNLLPAQLTGIKAPVQGYTLSLKERLDLALKGRLPFNPYGGGSNSSSGLSFWTGLFPGSKINYSAKVGPLYKNSAVTACIAWMQRNFSEARIRVTESVDGQDGARQGISKHPMTQLLRRPNPHYGADVLWSGSLFSLILAGNGYIHKARNGLGKVKELWWIPHWCIKPDWIGGDFISHYLYTDGTTGEWKKVPKEDIIHIRFGFNPENIREGYSPLQLATLPEIDVDNQGRNYASAILRNYGSPGAVLSPKDSTITVDDETRTQLETWWANQFTGDNRGKPLLPSLPIDVTKLSWSPEEMALDKILQRPEDRICAALGIPPMVVGLTSGGSSKTYANYREARSAAIEQNLIPTHQLFAQQLDLQLLPDFDDDLDHEVGWDYRNVRAMQDEFDKLWTRVMNGLKNGALTRDEARILLGMPPLGGDQGKEVAALAAVNSGLNQGDEPSGRSTNPDKNLGRPSQSKGTEEL